MEGLTVKGLLPLFHLAELAFKRWALREIDPMHPDLPRLVLRVNELERAL
jgi:hypothetical protein